MKKPIAILLTLALLIALPALAENALETAARSVQDASTLDAQLVLLYDISLEHAGAHDEQNDHKIDKHTRPAVLGQCAIPPRFFSFADYSTIPQISR